MVSQVSFIVTLTIVLLNYFVIINGQGLCFSEHNAERARHGKPALQYNDKLEQAAKSHSDLMARTGCFNHQCSGEPKPSERVSKAGYKWKNTAENIASGQKDCKDVMKSWMNSSGHKKNILGNSKDVGCARANNLWTCNFGTPA